MSKHGPIVLVEDDQDDQELIAEVLAELKVENELLSFYNGKEALDYLYKTPEQPFIIVCDINMPVMDGLRFREIIQTDEFLRRKSIPFVFLSTDASHTAVTKAYDLSAQGFFKKEVSFEGFCNSMKTLLDYWATCKHVNNTK